MKRKILRLRQQTLVVVPYWWDGTLKSLEGTILFHRPDLDLLSNFAISLNPKFSDENERQMMLASFPLDTSLIFEGQEWWVGEKWDGVRCVLDSKDNQLYSRSNIEIDFPSLHGVNGCLDGELWCGRLFLSEALTFAANSWDKLNSSCVRLMCFDEASSHLHNYPFETRYAALLAQVPADHHTIINAPRFMLTNEARIVDVLNRVVDGGGEGLILRRPHSPYVPGRSKLLLKLKKELRVDREALVERVESDGTLLLRLPTGAKFTVAKQDLLCPVPARGDIVTVSFETGLRNSGVENSDTPSSNPVIQRVRHELSWQDIVQDSSLLAVEFRHASKISPARDSTNKPLATRPWKSFSDRKAYFDKFAALKGFDALNPSFWYKVTQRELSSYHHGYSAIASYYGGKLSTTLMQLYPDIGLQNSGFRAQHYLRLEKAQRAYFEKFAAYRSEDPLNPKFWYSVTARELKSFDGGLQTIINYYGGKLSSALIQLYPHIGLVKSLFNAQHWKIEKEQKDLAISQAKQWSYERERRAFFDQFAAAKNKDPLDPFFWYGVRRQELMQFHNGYKGLLSYHGGQLSNAIMQLYPEIVFEESRFAAQRWRSEKERRRYFDIFADSRNMDSLNPVFWYTVTRRELIKYDMGFQAIARYYKGKLSTTLVSLYPNIGLKLYKFNAQHWKTEKEKRAFFDQFAASRGMDPLNPSFWHGISKRAVQEYHRNAYQTIMNFYGGSLVDALVHLYPNIGLSQSQFKS